MTANDHRKSFFVPKLCNHCEDSPCTQVCPVGATFDTPDGVVLVDKRTASAAATAFRPARTAAGSSTPTKTAEKCTFCYHRITKGLKPACVEVCPTGRASSAT